VVIYFIGIALLNFALGFALAAWQVYRAEFAIPPAAAPSEAATPVEPAPAAVAEEPVEEIAPPAAVEPPPPPPPEPPAEWGMTLEEAFGPALALEVMEYRSRLLGLVERASQSSDVATAHALMAEFGALNKTWAASSAAARTRLEECRDMVEDCRVWAERLIASLGRMEPPPETMSQLLSMARDEAGPGADCQGVIQDASALIEESQTLRDLQYEARLAVLQWSGNLDSASPELLRDPQTGMHNRLGLDAVHRHWLLQHPRDPWSVAVIDIDHFSELNRRLGAAVGDRVLTAFGSLVDDLLRKDSGFDRAGRCGADDFVLFLGDTTLDSAVNAVERIRQTIEASSFELPSEKVKLTVSIGVAAGSGREILADALADALEAARQAKEEGGNCTATHTEFGAQVEESRPFEIRGREVRVEAGAPALPGPQIPLAKNDEKD
jgi:diguanylate cyclase (GGDEF)-like protein